MPRFAPLSLSLLLPACGLFHHEPTTPTPAPLATPPVSAPPASASDADLRALVTEALTPQLCPKLLGSFLGLPGEGDAHGPAAGTMPSVGRWWIRRCDAHTVGDRLELSIAGSGWTWIDRESDGFRVRQYLLFDASASLGADVTLGYDREHRIASLWMTPAAGVQATIAPRGLVSAEPQGFFATILGGVAAATGTSISERARTQAAELGSHQLRDRLGAGFTMTFDLAHRQVDFMVGALQRGEVPERPYPPANDGPWIINQRSSVWPGGLDVVGPIDAAQGALALDATLEEGDGVTVRAVCSDALTRYFDARLRDPAATPAAPTGRLLATLTTAQPSTRLDLPTQINGTTCPMLLTVGTRDGATLPARLRYRIAASAPVAPTMAAAPAAPHRVRVEVVGASVSPLNPSGHSWDLVGGEADLRVITASVPQRREIHRTPVVADHNDASFQQWLPGTFDPSAELPLRFTVVDDDVTTEEFVAAVRAMAGGNADFFVCLRPGLQWSCMRTLANLQADSLGRSSPSGTTPEPPVAS